MSKTITVKAVWEFEVDVEDFDESFVDVKGLAKDLTQRELEYRLQHQDMSAEDFMYELEDDETKSES